ncbi:hypothetical protein [endosymbiont GvMRE of Glomus versiforme]|uniref:hypothetical protein n=1 Tax=endosymbiont GvMRE of Glomus versiforme TaxID=2039283 RepID=UPI0011C48B9D|nr:hypothetical protein [endosymbiont GvMRE of Glomus versiforme]
MTQEIVNIVDNKEYSYYLLKEELKEKLDDERVHEHTTIVLLAKNGEVYVVSNFLWNSYSYQPLFYYANSKNDIFKKGK